MNIDALLAQWVVPEVESFQVGECSKGTNVPDLVSCEVESFQVGE